MSVDHFEYRDLALTVDRGKVGQPSFITLDWVVVDDEGQDHDLKLTLGCELLIDDVEGARELSVVSVDGDSDAVDDFWRFVTTLAGSEIKDDGYVDKERMHDAAEGLGRALVLNDAKDRFPPLFLRVQP